MSISYFIDLGDVCKGYVYHVCIKSLLKVDVCIFFSTCMAVIGEDISNGRNESVGEKVGVMSTKGEKETTHK